MFQSTHPHGVRLIQNLQVVFQIHVSIHAPTRGATLFRFTFSSLLDKFQSTHPHGVRQQVSLPFIFWANSFNPRTHTGCDPLQFHIAFLELDVSIHAPTRGATGLAEDGLPYGEVSIHAPTRGATILNFQTF